MTFILRHLSTTERIAASFGPACGLPMCNQFFRPRATGRMEFSARLLLSSSSGYSRSRVRQCNRISSNSLSSEAGRPANRLIGRPAGIPQIDLAIAQCRSAFGDTFSTMEVAAASTSGVITSSPSVLAFAVTLFSNTGVVLPGQTCDIRKSLRFLL